MSVPDAIEPIVGYRSWRLAGDRLLSMYRNDEWPHDRPMEALPHSSTRIIPRGSQLKDVPEGMAINGVVGEGGVMLVDGEWDAEASTHDAPGNGCACGLYAYVRESDALTRQGAWWPPQQIVHGLVAGWGKVIRHSKGWRAQRVKVTRLFATEPLRHVVGAAADRYGCPVEIIEGRDPYAHTLAGATSFTAFSKSMTQFASAMQNVDVAALKAKVEGLAQPAPFSCLGCGKESPRSQGRYCRKCQRRRSR